MTVVTVAISQATPVPLGSNVTISDRVYTGSGWYSNREDDETEPGTITQQVWDLEGFYLDGKSLSLVSGFNLRDGQLYNNHLYTRGDIFLDVNGDAVYGPPNEGTGSGQTTVANTFGYDYALRLNISSSSASYSIYQLNNSSTLLTTVGESINQESNPWKYQSGGALLEDNIPLLYYHNVASADVQNLSGDKHYVSTVDLSFLSGVDVTAHFTMSCGNDNLMGQFHVPDSGSTALYSLLALGAIVLCRRTLSRA